MKKNKIIYKRFTYMVCLRVSFVKSDFLTSLNILELSIIASCLQPRRLFNGKLPQYVQLLLADYMGGAPIGAGGDMTPTFRGKWDRGT